MTTPIDLIDELDAMAEKATAGEWYTSRVLPGLITGPTYADPEAGIFAGRDAELIVALVNAWPRLAERIRSAERDLQITRDRLKAAEAVCEAVAGLEDIFTQEYTDDMGLFRASDAAHDKIEETLKAWRQAKGEGC